MTTWTLRRYFADTSADGQSTAQSLGITVNDAALPAGLTLVDILNTLMTSDNRYLQPCMKYDAVDGSSNVTLPTVGISA